ncbi:MAG: chorismate mutase [Nanoarchaeota archaeon]
MNKDIEKLRKKIDRIDSKIIGLLRDRLNAAENIGKYKKNNGLPIRDFKREKEILNRIAEKARKQGIKDIKKIKKVYAKIMESCRDVQRK